MSRYAENTSVSSEKSRAEIESTLQRYGATAFSYGWSGDHAMIQFAANGRQVRFVLDMPDKSSDEFWRTPAKRQKRDADVAYAAWEQACRQRWRALALVVKAKLEAVEAGISEFEDEFLSYVVLPDGSTAGQWLRPQIEKAYETGAMPAFLPELTTGDDDDDVLDVE